VGSFSLFYTSEPVHRKLIALFLVPSTIPIISTANVPPKQHEVISGNWIGNLPVEFIDMVAKGVEGFPFGLDEAKILRNISW